MEHGATLPMDEVDAAAGHSIAAVASPNVGSPSHSMHRPPPMSVVVVRKSSPLAIFRPEHEASSAPAMEASAQSTDHDAAESAERAPSNFSSLSSSSFRLQPRNPVCTPSPNSKAGTRGRKRSAQCLATSGVATLSRHLFPAQDGKAPGQAKISDPTETAKTPPSIPPSLKDCAESGGSASSAATACPGTPSVQVSMQGLSLRSPTSTPRRPGPSRQPGSSFILYSSASAGSQFVRPRSGSSSSTGSNKLCLHSPSSSSKSSPRFAPLKIVKQGGAGEENSKSTTRRPPLHGNRSSMLHSLDGSTAHDDDQADGVLMTPQQFPSNIQYMPECSNGSSITREASPAGHITTPHVNMTPSATPNTETHIYTPIATLPNHNVTSQSSSRDGTPSGRRGYLQSPRTPMKRDSSRHARSFRSPRMSTPSSRHSRSPHTPLPKVTLTPRTPSNRNRGLPSFPSPTDAEMNLIANDLRLGDRPQLFLPKRSKEGTASAPFLPPSVPTPKTAATCSSRDESSSSLALSTGPSPVTEARTKAPGAHDPIGRFLPHPRKSSYLPLTDWRGTGHGTPTKGSFFPPSFPSVGSNEATPQRNNLAHIGLDGAGFFGVKTKSLLTPSRSGGMLHEMMEQDDNAADMDADGSLTDTDDDEAFVLAAPATIADEREANSRARQRRRRSPYFGFDVSGLPSSASLTSSAQASNTSLFGMDIIHDSTSSSNLENSSSKTGSSEKIASEASKSNSGEQLGMEGQRMHHVKSEESLGSIGLALEASSDRKEEITVRDLVTPPVDSELSVAPPPLSSGRHHSESTPNNASICISSANPDAVNMTIARMAIQAHHLRTTNMECLS